ncbi:MAG: hypothetical protein IPK32_03675 [Verrucomicrobiaceae bacterium]|nr:hypothetical protein [Verrucomicrobiaceae bacterium]
MAALLLANCAGGPSGVANAASSATLSPAQMERVGKKIWQNECGGTVAGLTSWNAGEDFASLGIGHFIWYPAGRRGPFEESFPPLMAYYRQRGVAVPDWALGACPWSTKGAFQADQKGARLTELRGLLARTTGLQTEFILRRLERAAAGMGGAARAGFEALRTTPEGMFCMIDYVNFKGEGTNAKERYNGQGWGLQQVLEEMRGAGTPAAFAEASKRVLSRRVANAPPERGEKRWLAGWHARCERYKAGL